MTKKQKDAETQRPNPLVYGAAVIEFGEGVLKELSKLNIGIGAYRHLRQQLDILKEGQAQAEAEFSSYGTLAEPEKAAADTPSEADKAGAVRQTSKGTQTASVTPPAKPADKPEEPATPPASAQAQAPADGANGQPSLQV